MRTAAVILVLVATSCVEPARDDEILSRELAVARKLWNGTLIEFGSPRALPHLSEDGWSLGETAPDGNTFRWAVEDQASFTFVSEREGNLLAWLECEPFVFDGSPAQWIALAVNGSDVTELELRPGREAYPIELPVVVGENTVAMRFRYAGDPNRSSADRRRLAAAFYRFDIPPEGEAPVAGRIGPFTRVEQGVQLPAEGGLVAYADVDTGARLEVTARPGVSVSVRSAQSELVNETVDTSSSYELAAPGAIEIALHASEPTVVQAELFATVPPAVERELRAVDANIVLVFLDGANALRMSPEMTPVLDALAQGKPRLRPRGEPSGVHDRVHRLGAHRSIPRAPSKRVVRRQAP